jgi:hypothetical protein
MVILINGIIDQPNDNDNKNTIHEESLKIDKPISLTVKTKNVEIKKDLRSDNQILLTKKILEI